MINYWQELIEKTYLAWEAEVINDFPENMVDCIEHFLKEVHPRLELGKDLYPELFDSDLFFPLQRQAELSAMIRIARGYSPKVLMEIGADKGGGFYHLLKSLPSVEMACACEVRGTPYWQLFEDAFPRIDFLWLDTSSYSPSSAVQVHDWLHGNRIDVLFLDGDKSSYHSDLDRYLPLMNSPSVVFMHDINDYGGPRRAFDLAQSGPHGKRVKSTEEIISLNDTEIAMAREKRGIPAATPHEGWLRHWAGRSCGVGVLYVE